jgi:glutamate-ammonia-ligase adenylyltransferase
LPPEALRHRIASLPTSPGGAAALESLGEAARQQDRERELQAVLADIPVSEFLASALGDSPFLLDLAARDISRLAGIIDAPPGALVERAIAAIEAAEWPTRAEVMNGLRKARQNVALSIGLADLARAAPLDTITGALSNFADAACSAALRFALAEAERQGKWRGGPAETSGFFLLAMGKQGARELNYSA